MNTDNDIEFEDLAETGDELSLQTKIKELRKKLKEKELEAKTNLDGWQRARAELINKEKQLATEKLEIYKNASANLIEEILPALDSFEMAKRNKEVWEKVDSNWRAGIDYIFSQLNSVLENTGLKKIEPVVGANFDVNTMHAIEEVSTDIATSDHTISEVVQSGYELNGKLLREAKVKIFIKK